MEALELSNLKAEKRNMNIFSSITKMLRFFELCLALLFLLWFLTRLPFALRLTTDYLRSPLFIFAVFNAIIAALLAQSQLFHQSSSTSPVAEVEAEHLHHHHQISDTCTDTDSCAAIDPDFEKVCCGSLWNGKGEDENKKARRELQRSETEKAREKSYPHDKLSNEEFRRVIEAFIAKQMRLLREEPSPISLCN